MKYPSNRSIYFFQFLVLVVFLLLTFSSEIIDVPHYLLGDQPTSFAQRKGEVLIESLVFVIVVLIQGFIMNNLLKRIKILEGFIPICANCKKIRDQNQWEQMELYIEKNSLAKFSHSICPDCLTKLYPEFYPPKDSPGDKIDTGA